MAFALGLTGSIGMGKSTALRIFAENGCPVWSADEAVTRLYSTGGAAVDAVRRLAPNAVRGNAVQRDALRNWLSEDNSRYDALDAAVHPLIAADRSTFAEKNSHQPLIVFDIPLLFETGAEKEMDGVAVVTAPEPVQHARVMRRENMTEERLDEILHRQLPDAEKRSRADWLIDGASIDAARADIAYIIQQILGQENA